MVQTALFLYGSVFDWWFENQTKNVCLWSKMSGIQMVCLVTPFENQKKCLKSGLFGFSGVGIQIVAVN